MVGSLWVHSAGMDGAVSSWNDEEEVKEMLAERKKKLGEAVRWTTVLKEG